MALPITIDARKAALRYIEEASPKTLPGTPRTWPAIGVSTWGDFGASYDRVRREVFDGKRGLKEGTIVDANFSGGFTLDMLQDNLNDLLQGVMYADVVERPTTDPLNGSQVTITAVDTVPTPDEYQAASGLDVFGVNEIVLAENFGDATNNGLKTVASVAAGALGINETLAAEASPPATAKLTTVGYQFPTAEVDVDVSGALPKLVRNGGGSIDFTTIGLSKDDWIFIGGDAAGSKFTNTEDNGWARVFSVSATEIVFDKTQQTMVAETGTGLDIRIFFGDVFKDGEKIRTYHFERALGDDGDGTQYDYLTGAFNNQTTFRVQGQNKVDVEMNYLALDYVVKKGNETPLSDGDTKPALTGGDPFNTSVNFRRVKLGLVDETNSNITPFVAYARNLDFVINNNGRVAKALTVLGGIAAGFGDFVVTSSFEGYFQTVGMFNDIAQNKNVTLDAQFVKSNAGFVLDIPRAKSNSEPLNLPRNEEITTTLSLEGFEDPARGYTFVITDFKYLPNAAAA